MRPLLLLVWLGCFVVQGIHLAPSWTSDRALWQRVVEVAPHHARAMVNLADAYMRGSIITINTLGADPSLAVQTRMVTEQEKRLALYWAAMARQTVRTSTVLPARERRTVLLAADSNMVAILIGSSANAAQITELMEEIWQTQNAGSGR